MTSKQEDDIWYVEHNYYDDVKKQYNRAINYNYYQDDLDKIMPTINALSPNLKKNDEIISNFFRLLKNDDAFYHGIIPNYCKYINILLNEKFKEKFYHINGPKFDIFKTFVKELNEVRFGKNKKTCEDYINYIDTERSNKIKLLHGLYDAYKEIKTPNVEDIGKTCNNILFLSKNYTESIDKYYDDNNLYNKLDSIKNLILEKIGNLKSDCVKSIYFKKPTKVVELEAEQARKEADEAARKAQEEEAARQAQAEKERERLDLLQSKGLLSRSSGNELQEMLHGNGEFHSNSYQSGTRELGTSGIQNPAHRIGYPERSELSGVLLLEKDHTREGELIYTNGDTGPQEEGVYEQPGTDRTRSGMFGGSSGIPGYITEVFGSVDPVPVVGVSGGMGALFLLFRYTPLGTFFRGGRGRAHRIPRSFNGQFLGAFPDVNEYNGGYIGYGPMDIPYGAE
ncbi:hypothetical protein, conserved [Plasmodium vivax]|nr:hypothetical protein, conserved [Plasmodium vivax]